jgi:hypothetical protein
VKRREFIGTTIGAAGALGLAGCGASAPPAEASVTAPFPVDPAV